MQEEYASSDDEMMNAFMTTFKESTLRQQRRRLSSGTSRCEFCMDALRTRVARCDFCAAGYCTSDCRRQDAQAHRKRCVARVQKRRGVDDSGEEEEGSSEEEESDEEVEVKKSGKRNTNNRVSFGSDTSFSSSSSTPKIHTQMVYESNHPLTPPIQSATDRYPMAPNVVYQQSVENRMAPRSLQYKPLHLPLSPVPPLSIETHIDEPMNDVYVRQSIKEYTNDQGTYSIYNDFENETDNAHLVIASDSQNVAPPSYRPSYLERKWSALNVPSPSYHEEDVVMPDDEKSSDLYEINPSPSYFENPFSVADEVPSPSYHDYSVPLSAQKTIALDDEILHALDDEVLENPYPLSAQENIALNDEILHALDDEILENPYTPKEDIPYGIPSPSVCQNPFSDEVSTPQAASIYNISPQADVPLSPEPQYAQIENLAIYERKVSSTPPPLEEVSRPPPPPRPHTLPPPIPENKRSYSAPPLDATMETMYQVETTYPPPTIGRSFSVPAPHVLAPTIYQVDPISSERASLRAGQSIATNVRPRPTMSFSLPEEDLAPTRPLASSVCISEEDGRRGGLRHSILEKARRSLDSMRTSTSYHGNANVDGHSARYCARCETKFSKIRWNASRQKKHCGKCGLVLCASCVPHVMDLDIVHDGVSLCLPDQNVCKDCFPE